MSKVTFFSKTGGGEKSNLLNSYISQMSRGFEKLVNDIEVEPTIQMHIEIRIDGNVIIYGDPPGCSHLKFLKKKNVIANSITITEKQLTSLVKAKLFLKENIIVAFAQISDRLVKEKYNINKSDLIFIVETTLNKID